MKVNEVEEQVQDQEFLRPRRIQQGIGYMAILSFAYLIHFSNFIIPELNDRWFWHKQNQVSLTVKRKEIVV